MTELEKLLRQVEVNAQLQIQSAPAPIAPAPRLAPPSPPVAPPPPAPQTAPTQWPSHWAPAPDKREALRAEEAQMPQKPEVPPAPSIGPQVKTEPQPRPAEPGRPAEKPPTFVPPPSWSAPSEERAPRETAPEPSHQAPQKSLLDWENLIGGRLALWVGALCVFLALASFLVYVGKSLEPPPPWARVAAGFAASFALMGWASVARKRGQRWFVDGLLGTGLAMGFLSVWGGGPHFALWPLPVSLLGFSLYSAAGIALSARRDSQTLLVLASTGGFLTPVLVRNNNAQQLAFVFLSYLLVLNAGIVGVCVAKKWRELTYSAFVTTVLMVAVWGTEAHIEAMRPMLWAFASLGWILFGGAACFRSLIQGEKSESEDYPLLLSATTLYATTSQWLLAPHLGAFHGAFSLGLTVVLGALWWLARRRVPDDDALHANFLALACVAGTLFVPIQFGQRGLVWGWTAQSVALLYVGRKSNSELLRNAGRLLWGLSLMALASDYVLLASTKNSPLDAFSLRTLFCLVATAFALWDEKDETWAPIYGLVLSWGGAYWLGRTAWLGVVQSGLVATKGTSDAAFLLGASGIALWALFLWRFGWWRRQALLRANSWMLLGLALCAIAGVALWGQAPLVGLRMLGFGVGAASLLTMGVWNSRHENEDKAVPFESIAVGTASWLAFALTVEIAAFWHGGTFALPPVGTTAWFALCGAWSLFAAGAGALSISRTWPSLWTLAETLFAISTGVLLLQSLSVPETLVPVVNARFGAFVVAWVVALLARQVEGEEKGARKEWWLLVLSVLPLWASTQELWNAVAANHAVFGADWQRFASLSVSLCWSFYATLCLIIGVARRVQNLRLGALGLGALAVCKVFLFDLAFLGGELRVLSLGGLGIALLFISWLYSRFGRSEKNVTA